MFYNLGPGLDVIFVIWSSFLLADKQFDKQIGLMLSLVKQT